MIDLSYLPLIIPGILIVIFLGIWLFDVYLNWKFPQKPITYVWRNVWPDYKSEWERGSATSVYIDLADNDIRGKIVRQSDGLYLATMWNGDDKEFLFDFDATKWVEEYKPRIYK